MTAGHDLAQLNVARLRAPLDTPMIADFVANLAPVNALANAAPGFVWRLQTEDGDATAVRMLDDDMLIVNMSVWTSSDTLRDFVYRSGHVEMMRRRREWFERLGDPYVVLWWVRTGRRPSVAEAQARLLMLRANGPAAGAFTFARPFAPIGDPLDVPRSDPSSCPA